MNDELADAIVKMLDLRLGEVTAHKAAIDALLAAFVAADRSRNANLLQETMAIAGEQHRQQIEKEGAPLASQMFEFRMRQMQELVEAMQRG
jgi:hypothetical protein